jgi:hypothetical protein
MTNFVPITPAPPAGGLPFTAPGWPGGLQLQTYPGQPGALGVNHLVAGVTGKQIVILAYTLPSTGSCYANLPDTAGAALTPPWVFAAREGLARAPIAGDYLGSTGVGQGLGWNLSNAVAVNGEVGSVVFSGPAALPQPGCARRLTAPAPRPTASGRPRSTTSRPPESSPGA